MRLIVLFLGLNVLLRAAEPLNFSSGENGVHLLELYSSEGCSSCPPAEQWLGGLREAPGVWRDFVPVSFHVVYWDRLGWPDRFATKAYTERQYAYSAQWNSSSIYTPQFVLDGVEWHRTAAREPVLPAPVFAGMLSVSYASGGTCRISFAQPGDYEVHAALLGGGITSSVRAGENDGRTLHHEFVTLALKTVPLSGGSVELNLPRSEMAGVGRQALAVWITRPGELTPLQATGGWLE